MARHIIFPSKKGDALSDPIIVLVMLVIFAMVIIIGKQVFSDMNTDLQDDNDISTESKAIASDLEGRYVNLFDNLFLMAFVLLWIVMLLISMFTDSHPAIFIVVLFLMIFLLIAAMILGNTYEEFKDDAEISEWSSSFPKTNWILSNLLQVGIVVSLSVGFAFYAKNRFG